MMWLVILFIFTVIWYLLKPDPRLERLGNMIPGPRRLPIVGNLFTLPKTGKEDLLCRTKFIKEYGHVNRQWAGKFLMVNLSDPADIEVVLKHPTEIKKPFIGYEFMKDWLGSGLIASSGEKWACRRKLMTPTFHFEILEQYVKAMNERANGLVKWIRSEKGQKNTSERIVKTSIEIISETILGKQSEQNEENTLEYMRAIKGITHLTINRVFKPFLYNDLSWKYLGSGKKQEEYINVLNRYAKNIILEKEKTMETNNNGHQENGIGGKRKAPSLEMMLKLKLNGSPIFKTEMDILEEVNSLLFAGHDSVSTAISFALEVLARHQDVQEKLFEELRNNIADWEKISSSELNRLRYLDRVFREILRLYPPVPVIARQIMNDLKLPSGYTIPANTCAGISIHHVHRHPDHYDNPSEFNPDNFSEEASAKRHPFAFIPFSAGSRNCIGRKFGTLEFKIVLSKIISQFRVSLPEDCERDIFSFGSVVLRKEGGFNVILSER